MKRYQLKQRFFTGGAHMAKFPKWVAPVRTYFPAQSHSNPLHSYTGHSDPTYAAKPFGVAHRELLGGKEDLDGNLGKAMYQFFMGHPMGTSDFAQCRICLEVVRPSERREHSEKHGCYSIMVRLLKELSHNECIICDKPTTSCTWDVPLCSAACRELWKFEVCQPSVLLAGVGRSLREKTDAKNK